MEREEIYSGIGTDESECYAFRIGFNAAVVATIADALSENSEMRMDTLVEALAAEFASQFNNFEDPPAIIDDFMSAIVERILDNLEDSDSDEISHAVTGFEETMGYILGRTDARGAAKDVPADTMVIECLRSTSSCLRRGGAVPNVLRVGSIWPRG